MTAHPSQVLFVSADPRTLKFLTVLAQSLGYEVLTAAQGREGLIHAWRARPPIIVFDTDLPDMDGLTFARKLHNDARTAQAYLLPLADKSDFQAETAYLAAGCVGYLVKSPQLVQTLQQFLDSPARAGDLFSRAEGYLLAFLSAKGGVGTSSLCINLADSLGREEDLVCLADLVLPIGSVAPIVGYVGEYNLVKLAAQPDDRLTAFYVKEQLERPERWHFSLLPGSPDPEQASRLAAEKIAPIVDALRAAYDYVFLDLGRSLSRISLPLLLSADLVVLVVGTDVSAAELSRIVVNYLQEKGVPRERLFVIVNRAVGLEGLNRDELSKMLGLPVEIIVPYLRDNLTLANNQHVPFLTKYNDHAMRLVFRDLAVHLQERAHHLREAQEDV